MRGIEISELLYREYIGILNSLPADYFDGITAPYGGTVLRLGSEGENVTLLQEYLNFIANTYPTIPKVSVDGVFGPATQRAVLAYKEIFGLGNQAIVSSSTWDSITSTYRDLYDGELVSPSQFPGYNIG